MTGVILAVVERPETAAVMLSAAARLAGLAAAGRIIVLAIRTPPLATIMPTEEILTPREEARIRNAEQARAQALKRIFERWEGSLAGFAARWCDVEARADAVIGERGRRADALVLQRPLQRMGEPERQATRAALFDTDRPVLLVPPETSPAPFGRKVAVAWRDDSRSTGAVLASLRWLARPERIPERIPGRIDVLCGVRDGTPPPRLPDILAEHGLQASLHVLPIIGGRSAGAMLLAKAHEIGADLLIMGAYAHSPLRESILGGVTRFMLAHADLPILMRH